MEPQISRITQMNSRSYLLNLRHLRFVLLLCLGAAAADAQPATTQSADRWPIEYRHEERADPKLHLHVVTIDLTDARVRVEAFPCGPDPDGEHGPWQMTLDTVRNAAARHALDVAVNANFFMTGGAIDVGGRRVPYFAGNRARAVGWLVSDGKLIADERGDASLVVRADGRVEVGQFDQLPRDARHVVSGSQQILRGGRITARGDVRAPRTAAGLNADASRLTLLVVDGRLLSHSVGMSELELAREMLRLGCTDALNLDGGGSSTLVLRHPPDAPAPKLMNRPSDGHDLAVPLSIERSVACVLGVRVARERGPTTAPAKEERP